MIIHEYGIIYTTETQTAETMTVMAIAETTTTLLLVTTAATLNTIVTRKIAMNTHICWCSV